ncbi:hypothetical protein GCM10017774_77580 [Lentzea cavernae]|uniref:Secreted protein n=1 Tax=Lentzea cavernae TaxID=2020703 RepID=A0ABQ3MT58_9PSEU|nr:hypothetical protein GCM10017774_77580 [Lentzea cavernae]
MLRHSWWHVSYYGHLLLLALLAAARFVFFGLAVLAHRMHTDVAAHGQVVADTLSATSYTDRVRPRSDRYARMAYFLLHPRTTEHKETS